jgi:hypothetical protein
VRKSYGEKKRGRPAGWSKQMREALADVSDRLQDVGDKRIDDAIVAHRAGRVGTSQDALTGLKGAEATAGGKAHDGKPLKGKLR